jgi:hypothetical protein
MNDFVGMVFTRITRTDEAITFEALLDGRKFVMEHQRDCCESVYIESIVGDLDDLLFSPILMAEEATNHDNPKGGNEDGEYSDESHTWTFYKFATIKGYVDIRWYGSSNGYYSETASIREVTHD